MDRAQVLDWVILLASCGAVGATYLRFGRGAAFNVFLAAAFGFLMYATTRTSNHGERDVVVLLALCLLSFLVGRRFGGVAAVGTFIGLLLAVVFGTIIQVTGL